MSSGSRKLGLAAVVVALAGMWAWAQVPAPATDGAPAVVLTGSEAIHVISSKTGDHQAVLYDPETRSLAVYHINRDTGSLSLKSVRRIEWDLQLTDFNTSQPLPQDIRNGLQQRP